MKNIDENGISFETKKKIALVNSLNPYVDITPFELNLGIPFINYPGFYVQHGELIVYVTPAQTFTEKNMTVGYESDLRGISYEVWDDVTVHKGKTSDRTIHDNVRDYNKGDLIITNKRIVFIGINDNFELKVSDISATKIIDETSFIILSGSVLRNIKLDENLVIYAYGFINYVVSNYKNGVDVYSVLKKQMEEITPEQINLCRIINQEAHDIRLAELEKKRKVRMAILFSFVAVIAMLAFFSSNSTKTYDYSALELIDLPDHPRIFDKIEDATKYYRNIRDDRVAIVSIQKHCRCSASLTAICSFFLTASFAH